MAMKVVRLCKERDRGNYISATTHPRPTSKCHPTCILVMAIWTLHQNLTCNTHPACILAMPCLQHTVCCTHPSNLEGNALASAFIQVDQGNTREGAINVVYSLPNHSRGNCCVYFFLDTPTVFPLWPVVLVCWPLTWQLRRDKKYSMGKYSSKTYPQAPVMPKTPVGANLLQTLKILTELVVQHVSHDLGLKYYDPSQKHNIITWLVFPSLMSLCLLRNQSGILYWRGFWDNGQN